MKLTVEKQDILAGRKVSIEGCPVALRIRRRKGVIAVRASHYGVWVHYTRNNGQQVDYKPDSATKRFMRRFDNTADKAKRARMRPILIELTPIRSKRKKAV